MNLSRLSAAVLVVLMAVIPAQAKDYSKFEEVEVKKLKAAPEEYLNKNISCRTNFLELANVFHDYMEKSGFKAGKHFWLRARPGNLPVIGDKKECDGFELVDSLDEGDGIIIYGKIKNFLASPVATRLPHYYFQVEKIVRSKKDDRKSPDNKVAAPLGKEGKADGIKDVPPAKPKEKPAGAGLDVLEDI